MKILLPQGRRILINIPLMDINTPSSIANNLFILLSQGSHIIEKNILQT